MFINTQVYGRKMLVFISSCMKVIEEIISTLCDSEYYSLKHIISILFLITCNRFAYL